MALHRMWKEAVHEKNPWNDVDGAGAVGSGYRCHQRKIKHIKKAVRHQRENPTINQYLVCLKVNPQSIFSFPLWQFLVCDFDTDAVVDVLPVYKEEESLLRKEKKTPFLLGAAFKYQAPNTHFISEKIKEKHCRNRSAHKMCACRCSSTAGTM